MNLEDFRKQIDQIDQKVIKLLKKRFEISQNIREFKQQNGLSVLDNAREDQILNRAAQGDYSQQIKAVYKTVLEQSKQIQK